MPHSTDHYSDIRPDCDGSLNDLGWEGGLDEESRPRKITCSVCGAKLWADVEEYLAGPKEGLFFAQVPLHYPEENSKHSDWSN